jgi:hypothetical protein
MPENIYSQKITMTKSSIEVIQKLSHYCRIYSLNPFKSNIISSIGIKLIRSSNNSIYFGAKIE